MEADAEEGDGDADEEEAEVDGAHLGKLREEYATGDDREEREERLVGGHAVRDGAVGERVVQKVELHGRTPDECEQARDPEGGHEVGAELDKGAEARADHLEQQHRVGAAQRRRVREEQDTEPGGLGGRPVERGPAEAEGAERRDAVELQVELGKGGGERGGVVRVVHVRAEDRRDEDARERHRRRDDVHVVDRLAHEKHARPGEQRREDDGDAGEGRDERERREREGDDVDHRRVHDQEYCAEPPEGALVQRLGRLGVRRVLHEHQADGRTKTARKGQEHAYHPRLEAVDREHLLGVMLRVAPQGPRGRRKGNCANAARAGQR
mmetsp:Transcript_39816/g.116202  ORF Transcript_39816/g.116202 Transcript_39816/m.116202 type:complete len:324 (+) Transcript_39816:521-1492(+)